MEFKAIFPESISLQADQDDSYSNSIKIHKHVSATFESCKNSVQNNEMKRKP